MATACSWSLGPDVKSTDCARGLVHITESRSQVPGSRSQVPGALWEFSVLWPVLHLAGYTLMSSDSALATSLHRLHVCF